MFILQLVSDNPYGSWCYTVILWSETPGKRSELFSAPKTQPRLKTNLGWHKAILINKDIRLLLLVAEIVPAHSEVTQFTYGRSKTACLVRVEVVLGRSLGAVTEVRWPQAHLLAWIHLESACRATTSQEAPSSSKSACDHTPHTICRTKWKDENWWTTIQDVKKTFQIHFKSV